MTPDEFVASLSVAVVDENNAIYRSLLLNTRAEQAADPYWQRVLKLFGELSADQREVLLELTRQVTIDAVANVLGIIDGTCRLSGEGGRFRLICAGGDLGGDLQTLFLEHAEHASS
ncbi:hypothetical protein [Dyella telluris]|uniref:Uncharacterized protein n=1 Tax=Dyella telluris TaxID=2763498 RepID=A0A7G8Q633_9GAMM|nr:hypothetical protein [Dyella telluris]QNK02241.1 hypothetical protein H8F01_03515 [Dyella telluris]